VPNIAQAAGQHFRRASSVMRLGLSRNELFAGLAAIGFVNGISEKVMAEWAANGPLAAVFDTFDISVIVWAATLVGLMLLLRDRDGSIGSADLVVGGLAALTFLVPVPSLSWLGIDLIAIYLLKFAAGSAVTLRAAAILFAVTIPMFWGRLLMAAFGHLILQVDATLVSWFVGTSRSGNVVPFADGSGAMWVAPACSSFTNLSLAILAAVLFVKAFDRQWSARTLLISGLACASVVVINVVRIGLIGLHPEHFELLHGDVGATVAGWMTTAAILGLCAYGIGRDAPAAA
jgi:exosortase/archaeosortase family protein